MHSALFISRQRNILAFLPESEFVENAGSLKRRYFRQFIYVKLRTAVGRCKNLPFTCKTDKNRRKMQFSFVPYLTSTCPARRLYRTGSDATAAGGGVRELSEWQRSIKSRKSVSPKILSGTATGFPRLSTGQSDSVFRFPPIRKQPARGRLFCDPYGNR